MLTDEQRELLQELIDVERLHLDERDPAWCDYTPAEFTARTILLDQLEITLADMRVL